MITLRLSTLEKQSGDTRLEIAQGENIAEAVKRTVEHVPLEGRDPSELFMVIVNGHVVPPNQWAVYRLNVHDDVTVAPWLHGDVEKGFARQFLVIAATITAAYFTGGASIWVHFAITAAATIGTSLLANALIPPSNPGSDALSTDYSYSDSQMYAVTSQSNQVSKYNTVPKTYGTHRVFPNVAANPYTELEAGEDGEINQYFYAIYDFGLGPATVESLQIGDTPLINFDDLDYNLVDLNKPDASEGTWDDNTVSEFQYYKQSATGDAAGIVLSGNSETDTDSSTFQFVRNAAPNSQLVGSDIILNFVAPQGLYAFASNGARGTRTVNLTIEFAKVETNDWHGYNDFDYVSDFLATGGDSVFADQTRVIPGLSADTSNQYFKITAYSAPQNIFENFYYPGMDSFQRTLISYQAPETRCARIVNVGLKAGTTQFPVANNSVIKVGQAITMNRTFVGRVAALDPFSTPGYTLVTLDNPTRINVHLGLFAALFASFDESIVSLANVVAVGNSGVTRSAYPYFTIDDKLIDLTSQSAKLPSLVTISSSTFIPSKAVMSASTQQPFYATFRFTPKVPANYKIRVTRTSTTSDYNYTTVDSITFTDLTTRFDSAPIKTTKRHLFLELRVRATNQLNGAISNLSGIVSSVLDVYDETTGTWAKQKTNNPAWVFADLLTGEVNKRAIAKSRLHTPSLLDWAEYCNEVPAPPPSQSYFNPRFTCNFVLDYQTTLAAVLNQVANAANASLNIVDGKYGVLIDMRRSTPVQIFTPRNSKDFSSQRVYTAQPDGLQITYIDPDSDWNTNQVTVYDAGQTEETASTFDDLTSFACTNHEQAWRFGRYMLAQNRLRQETISITTDFEYLVCSRGDYVQVVQDVMRVGGTAARVKSVTSQRIVIDEGLETNPALQYGFVYRSRSGTIGQGSVTPFLSDTFDVTDGAVPEAGDLIVIGIKDEVVYDCLVKTITPGDNFSAQLTLVEKADAIYDAESTDTLPDYTPQISQTYDPDLVAPPAVEDFTVTANSYRCNGLSYQYYVGLDWDAPLGSAPEYYEVYADSGRGLDLITTTRDSQYEYIVDSSKLGFPHLFKVLAVSSSGKKIDIGAAPSVSATPVSKTTPPGDVASLSIDITGEVLQLVWPKVDQCDIANYLVRFAPVASNADWANSTPLLRIDRNTTLSSTQARTGTYLIKAVDFNGNESQNAAEAVTTIPNLFNLNIIETVNDAPTWTGSKDRTAKLGDFLVLQNAVFGGTTSNEYYSEGYYYYANLLDLSEIYTVRLQSLIQSTGVAADDLMSNWATLDQVLMLANAQSPDWDVEVQYRSTENYNVMSEWATLAAIDPISEGQQDAFTPWRKFLVGDATGRIFQFRLKLISNKASVTPKVYDATIRADMPDRLESYNNLVSDAVNGYEIVYTPRFKGPSPSPNVQVTIDNAQSGDYWAYDYKTLDGVKVRFFDKTGAQVSRQFDLSAKGYGRRNAAVI